MERIISLFADILEYPQSNLLKVVQECQSETITTNPEAGAMLGEFRGFVEGTPLNRLQEIYSSTFDLNATSCLYAGHYLFGESYERSMFLIGLKERYNACGFTAENELPDHLTVLLRFIAVCDKVDVRDEIISEALLPALTLMTGGKGSENESQSQYFIALKALEAALRQYKKEA
ncbi:MAG: nitrate reductase molybdenum cofactor assembly chaperone [Candidatus Methanoperedens sp.]|nr:nitrate reductase molybdenum cofactor assembly chaperone [Candidatus Methanoperedens sp.]CAG0967470.1 putative nitrate reductase molybdenum cofactor assembly chaperone NarW [Methanosarcinales archaeon]